MTVTLISMASEINFFEKYSQILQYEGLYSKGKRLSFYLKNYLFEDIELQGRSLLDIGSGRGLYSFFAGFAGAKKVVCIEPELGGSHKTANDMFERLATIFCLPQIEIKKIRFQDFDSRDEMFDVILLHHSINHLDEEACADLKTSEQARKIYGAMFKKLVKMSHSGTKLIIADCSPHNLFSSLNVRNPLAPTIKWQKHQSPYFWCGLLREFGFTKSRIRWTAPGGLFKVLLGNPVASYFLISHYVLTLTKL